MNSTPDSGVPASPEEIQVDQVRVGLLSSVTREIQVILKEIFPGDDEVCTLSDDLGEALLIFFVYDKTALHRLSICRHRTQ